MVDDKRKIIFVHVPRTSGSSIEDALGVKYTPCTVNEKHERASNIKRRIGTAKWEDYWKFSVTRNPYDRVVSLYHMRHNKSIGALGGHTLEHFLNMYTPARHEQGETCSDYIDEELDFVGRFEDREELFKTLNKHITDVELSVKHRFDPDRTNRDSYDKYIDTTTASMIQDTYSQDFERFGYSRSL